MRKYAIDLHDVSVTIKHKEILSHLDLQVEEGAFHGIIGPNGAGKTTLFNVIQGFLKPTQGSVELLGHSPYPRNLSLLAKIGIQPQQPAFFPRTTLREHLKAVADIYAVKPKRIDLLLEALNLAKAADTKVEKLSGGERQRLAVASAIVHRPKILFLDEPTAGLDPESRHSLVSLLQSTDLLEMTTLYTTHYLEEAERLCDTVSIMEQGRIIITSSPSQLIAAANLGSTVLLPKALPQADTAVKIFGTDSVRVTPDGLAITTKDTAALFTALTENRIDTTHAQVQDGRLEDVYLQLTGKEYVQ